MENKADSNSLTDNELLKELLKLIKTLELTPQHSDSAIKNITAGFREHLTALVEHDKDRQLGRIKAKTVKNIDCYKDVSRLLSSNHYLWYFQNFKNSEAKYIPGAASVNMGNTAEQIGYYFSMNFYTGRIGYLLNCNLQFLPDDIEFGVNVNTGSYDDILVWPFQKCIQLTIVNQRNEEGSLLRKNYGSDGTYIYPFRVKISKEILNCGKEAKYFSDFICNDCMLIKVELLDD